MRIIEELGRGVSDCGGRLAVLDASKYFGDDDIVSKKLTAFCDRNGFGYIPLHEDLLEANMNGVPTHWPHDGHFNEAGNMIAADAVYDWIAAIPHTGETQ